MPFSYLNLLLIIAGERRVELEKGMRLRIN